MKQYFGYIRVSDPKQKTGVSLQVQEATIRTHASRQNIVVVEWFRENKTAAKAGRGLFTIMLAKLKTGAAQGVIFHKIDRSARNLEDWNLIGKLFDSGVDVQFAHENVDLGTRGGRLAADIQAVVAADFIRNNRQEAKKGFYGRLNDGIYPLPAPIGYLDCGKGKPKAIDPVKGPLVRHLFERYASGDVGLIALRSEAAKMGITGRRNRPLSQSSLAQLLHNSFYAGLIRLRRTNETFAGKHEALIPKRTFDRVQAILAGRTVPRIQKNVFTFRMLLQCAQCNRHLVGERQKGVYVYYRCHGCAGTCLAENALDKTLAQVIARVRLSPVEMEDFRDLIREEMVHAQADVVSAQASLRLRLTNCEERLARATDALIDGLLDKASYETRKALLLSEQRDIFDAMQRLEEGPTWLRLAKELELNNDKLLRYEIAEDDEKRDTVVAISSNCSVRGKYPTITLKNLYQEMSKIDYPSYCAPNRRDVRTRVLKILEIVKSTGDAMDRSRSPSSPEVRDEHKGGIEFASS